ncbi:MAG: hypothetical protein FWD86_01275, partial [Firmicutes bacterium]|nr:hypothetical protein [Bacillota bacterium]
VTLVMPTGLGSRGTSLSLNVFYFFQVGQLNLAAATSVVLLAIVLSINLAATLIGKLLSKKKVQE